MNNKLVSKLINISKNSVIISGINHKVISFGNLNPKIYFYVIRQQSTGRGLFSLVSSVLCHIDIALKNNFIPIIDFENFQTVYNEGVIDGTSNSWEYYFHNISNFKLDEVYESKNVIFSSNQYPIGYDFSITKEKKLYEIFYNYFKLKDSVINKLYEYQNLMGNHILGVHYRGQEMRTARGHWFPPSFDQIKFAINELTKAHDFQKIFIVTEDSNLLGSIKKEYGDIVISTNSFRTSGENAYKIYPRKNHLYNLGLEILIDTILLSMSGGIVKCSSNVAEFATFMNNDKYFCTATIDNGPNTRIWPLNYLLWSIKNMLPSDFYGFKNNNIVIKK